MPIFQDPNGLAIKFFIQKDISQEIQAELCETITSLGGRVEIKVPRQGFILVQPRTAEEERLRQCWITADRPDRFMVPYTYVEACKITGMLLKQIFIEDGKPIPMHIHPSIANPNARNLLISRIMHSGGDPDNPLKKARVVLADPNTEVFQHLIKTYQNTPGKYIESYLWVKKCIEKGEVAYTPVVYRNPGGRRPGEERTQFTEEDEDHLCWWIAQKIPYKETGGRTGNRLYQQLCEQTDPEYSWVSRHTWQSWRERYKKNAYRLDDKIARIVAEKRPVQGEHGQYGYVRQAEEKPKRTRKRRGKNEETGTNSEEGATSSQAAEDPALLLPMPTVDSIQPNIELGSPLSPRPPTFHTLQALPGFPPLPPSHSHLSMLPPTGPPTTSSRPDEEEMEDNEESQWVVRVGNEPPPTWAKRKAVGDDPEQVSPSKRPKPSDNEAMPELPDIDPSSQVSESSQSPTQALHTSTLVALANINLHVIDQSLRQIAQEYRFTLDEVKEFYDRCGEMGRTRERFQYMRKLLTEMFASNG